MPEFHFEPDVDLKPLAPIAIKELVSDASVAFLAQRTGTEVEKFWILPARTRSRFPIEPDAVFDVFDMRADGEMSEATRILRFGLFERTEKALLLIPSDEAKGELGNALRDHLLSKFEDANSLLHAAQQARVDRRVGTIKFTSIGAAIAAIGTLAWYGFSSIGAQPILTPETSAITRTSTTPTFEQNFAVKLTDIRQTLRASASKDIGQKVSSIGLADIIRLKERMLSDDGSIAMSALEVYHELVLVARESKGTLFNNRDLSAAYYSEHIHDYDQVLSDIAKKTTSIAVRERALSYRETLSGD